MVRRRWASIELGGVVSEVVEMRGTEARYRLLLLAHTVQNFSLKPPSSVGLVGAWGLGCCWPFVCEGCSVVPSTPMVVVSGTSSGGGGGGGGCARRLGSVDMVVNGRWIEKECVLLQKARFACEDGNSCFATCSSSELHIISLHKSWRMDPRNDSSRLSRLLIVHVSNSWLIKFR